MKIARTRILMAVVAASLVVTTFMDWDECECRRGFVAGWNAGRRAGTAPMPEPADCPPQSAPTVR